MTSLLHEKESQSKNPIAFNKAYLWEKLHRLQRYVQAQEYEGHDLFDGLNSQLAQAIPLYKNRLFRLALIQFCKRSPINIRPLLQVPTGFNPKGGALFLMGYLNLAQAFETQEFDREIHTLYQKLWETRIPRGRGLGWGYNFDWQARAFFVPEGIPNLVTSVFVGRALLAYFQQFQNEDALAATKQITLFILNEMIHFETDTHLCFNYIHGKDAEVHNANLLGAAYLAQMLPYLQEEPFQPDIRQKILKAVHFSIGDIQPDGSWPYGTKSYHRWVDHFHTAYNIEALLTISRELQTDQFDDVLERVLHYYFEQLFTPEGLPKYFHAKTDPTDIHVIAETLVLLNLLKKHNILPPRNRCLQIQAQLSRLLEDFQDPKGYFYHQRHGGRWNRIPYIRWGQAWMFYGLSTCLIEK